MSQTLQNIIFNPTWTVPEDIRKNEHPALLAKDPKYYEKNGFDVIRNGNHVLVRQRPGPNNALGFVKFVFPNDHNIYMHDTPMRGMFRHPVRAFSHGCVRVDEPLLFAEVLMREDGEQRPKFIIDRYMESGRTGDYTPKRPIPVHIDYILVRVEDDGVVTFGTDIYRRDRPLIMRRLERMGFNAAQFFPDTAP
jgi:murein L,D-transpeptidase YcbB/YkuD